MARYELDCTLAATAAEFEDHPDNGASAEVVVATDGGVDVLRINLTVASAFKWRGQSIPAVEDMEVLCRIRGTVNSSSRRKGPAVRMRGNSSGTNYNYRGGWRGNTSHQINRNIAGGNSDGPDLGEFTGLNALSYHWRRLRVTGSTVQLKIWTGDLSDEPGSWNISITDTNVTGDGYVGFSGNDNGFVYVSHMYVATNGDTAGPVGPGTSRRNMPLLLTPW